MTSATALRLGDGRGALGASGASSACAAARTKGTARRGHVGASSCGGWRKLEAASIGKDDEASMAAPAACYLFVFPSRIRLGRCER